MSNPTGKENRMMFRRIGGACQLALRDIDDMASVLELDEAHWAITGIDIDSLRADRQFLDFIDDDRNGKIRVDEVRRAVSWFLARIRPESHPKLGSPDLLLESIDTSTPEGETLLSAAQLVLRNLGIPDSPVLSLSHIRDDKGILSRACCNGDGVITPEGLACDCGAIPGLPADPRLAEVVRRIMEISGSCKDLAGEEGINREILDKFIENARKFLAWCEVPAEQPELLLPYGDHTADFAASVEKLRERIDSYFLHCAALEFLPGLTGRTPGAGVPAEDQNSAPLRTLLENAPLAAPRADRVLDFSDTLNPLFAEELRALAADPAMTEFLSGSRLSEEMWRRLVSSLAAWFNWKKEEPAVAFETIGVDVLRQWLNDGTLEQLRIRIDGDLAVAAELTTCTSLLKLVLFHRDLLNFLNNYVSLSELFNPNAPSMLQTGKLVMDGRHYTFATPVKNIAEHKRIATMSDICVLYVEVTTGTKEALRKMTLAVAVTSGNIRNLFIGKHGIFFTSDGTAWDAGIIDLVQQPVSISEALKMPFFRFGEFVGKQADRFFSTKSAEAQKALEQNIASGALLPPSPARAAKPQTPAVSGSMLLMGGGIGIAAIGSSVAFIIKSLQNISVVNVLAVLLGIILIFGGPMVVISLVKLYRRNISRFLEANACAVNRPMRLSRKMGAVFTFAPPLPRSGVLKEDLVAIFRKPVVSRSPRVLQLLLLAAAVIAAGLGWFLWTL